MELSEIISGYEDFWMRAALEDQKQMRPGKPLRGHGSYGACAWLNPDQNGQWELAVTAGNWDCKWMCGCGYKLASVAAVMVHLNNVHDWTWDMFANKFRDALRQGGVDV